MDSNAGSHSYSIIFVYQIINGNIPSNQRTDIVDDFHGNETGQNLIGANHLFLVYPHWNLQLEVQVTDRIFRIGQTKSVYVQRIVIKDSVEEKCWHCS
jgi:SNF2 family DNA or RNA helicase